MDCRIGCGGCCIALSITSPIPGMPEGKPAGIRCVNLDENFQCRIWGLTDYPEVCRNFRPEPDFCGTSRDEALQLLSHIETLTAPGA